VRLSIDIEYQVQFARAVEAELRRRDAEQGAVVVLRPDTGEILASMLRRDLPRFEPKATATPQKSSKLSVKNLNENVLS
jgi:cell division protein FtsI/penicillin-binding protein 2